MKFFEAGVERLIVSGIETKPGIEESVTLEGVERTKWSPRLRWAQFEL